MALAAAAWAAGAASHSDAAAEAPAAPAWIHEIELDGFLAASYSLNFNRPPSGGNQLRVFDLDDRTFELDEFELVMQKAVAAPHESGFRVDLTVGSVSRVAASAGLFRDDAGKAGDLDAHQIFASYMAPLGSGLRFDLGKFITPAGYEVIDGYDGWNDNATRSLLFGFAIPFTHVGARASYAFSPRLSAMAMVVNGWDVARDDNHAKSWGAQLSGAPLSVLTLTLSGLYGPERPGDDVDARRLLDGVAVWKVVPSLILGANADWGSEDNAVGPGRDGRWNGVAGYLRVGVTKAVAVALRGESFDDPEGVRTGTAQRLSEITATCELRLTPHFLVRADGRVDRSTRAVFEKSSRLVTTQPTAFLQAIESF